MPGQVQIEDDELRHGGLDLGDRVFTVLCGHDLVTPGRERATERPQDLHLVVDDEDPAHVSPRLPATAIANVAPPPGVSSTQISPSIATTKPFAIASPRPGPSLGLR